MRTDSQTAGRPREEGREPGQLGAVLTGWGPKVDSALLAELLERTPGLAESLSDPAEVHADPAPLAGRNAYKHRIHALRREYAGARLRTVELEGQLAEERLRILRLEARVKHLEATLEWMTASRVWKLREWCARCRRTVARWLPCRGRPSAEAAPPPGARGPEGTT